MLNTEILPTLTLCFILKWVQLYFQYCCRFSHIIIKQDSPYLSADFEWLEYLTSSFKILFFSSQWREINRKDTWRSLSATHQVDASGDDMGGFTAPGQVFVQRHLVEVEGRVQTVLVHLQLSTQSVDVLFSWGHIQKYISSQTRKQQQRAE